MKPLAGRYGGLTAWVWGGLLAVGVNSSIASEATAAVPATAAVSVQVVNPDVKIAIRLVLDGKVIFDAAPLRSPVDSIPTIPAVAGPFALSSASRHELIAEAAGASTRAQLVWTPQRENSAWVVVHYYPGRTGSNTPAFFAFALQSHPHKLR